MTTTDPTAEPFSTYTFTDADGDVLSIGRAAFPAGGTPSVSIYTPTGEPVHVPNTDVPAVIVALGQAAGITHIPAPDPADVAALNAEFPDEPQDPTTGPAVLPEAERTFLAFALGLAFDRMVSDDGFTDDDEAAYASLRKLAGGES